MHNVPSCFSLSSVCERLPCGSQSRIKMTKCAGCDNDAATFQCPLCQAEEAEGEGYFCSQECFAKNWLAHRDGVHKGGTVRAGAKRKRDPPADAASPAKDKSKKGDKKKVEDVVVPAAPKTQVCCPWAPVPDYSDCKDQKWAVVRPALTKGTTRAVVELKHGASTKESLWTAMIASANFAEVAVEGGAHVLVVAGSPFSAHAMAWVLRCAGIVRKCRLVLSTADDDMQVLPSEYFSDSSIVITSTTVLRARGKKAGTNVSEWTNDRTLVTLPDVKDPESLQSITARAVFFVTRCSSEDKLDAFEADEVTHHVDHLWPQSFDTPIPAEDLGTRFDNTLSTQLAHGNLPNFAERVVNIFSTSKNRCEEVLTNSLFCDWGCVGGDAALAHHKLAYVMRFLADHSSKFATSSLDLVQIAVRTVCRVCRSLPPVPVAKTISETTNLSLQATVCYLYSHMSSATVDSFGESWGFTKVLEGPTVLKAADKLRKNVVARIHQRYGAKLGQKYAEFLVILMHFISDAVSTWSLSLEEVDRATRFTETLSHEVGSLATFLTNCQLYGHSKDVSSNMSLLSQHERKRRVEAGMPTQNDLRGLVHPATRDDMVKLPFEFLPVSGRRQRAVDKFKEIAVEEILSAMPRQPIPMYIGDVGNLIGIWTKFNARYDGALGYTLSLFLQEFPDKFTVVGNVVTRVKAGNAEPVRVRFDNEIEEGSDDDDNKRKRRDRAALTGLGSKDKKGPVAKSAKARKKAAKKEQNAARYNKNRIKFDPEKKVPGYVKHGPRKIKGRGKKTNIRRFKRAE